MVFGIPSGYGSHRSAVRRCGAHLNAGLICNSHSLHVLAIAFPDMGRDLDLSLLERIRLRDPALESVRRTLLDGSRLNLEQGTDCLASLDVWGLAGLAHAMKQARHGDVVSYVLNRQLNPTNLCWLDCSFCDFAAKPGDAHAYEYTDAQIVDAVRGDIREVHIVGGLHPRWSFAGTSTSSAR